MKKVFLKIKKAVSPCIFYTYEIKEKMDKLFADSEELLKQRFDELKQFVVDGDENSMFNQITYEEVADYFEIMFFKLLANDAVEIVFSDNEKYNIKEIILELLSKDKLENAISGELMINAFERVMSKIPTDSALSTCLIGSKKILLEKEFLGKKSPLCID